MHTTKVFFYFQNFSVLSLFYLASQEEDKKVDGISLDRYQELYAQFISNPDEKCNAVYLFGPLVEV